MKRIDFRQFTDYTIEEGKDGFAIQYRPLNKDPVTVSAVKIKNSSTHDQSLFRDSIDSLDIEVTVEPGDMAAAILIKWVNKILNKSLDINKLYKPKKDRKYRKLFYLDGDSATVFLKSIDTYIETGKLPIKEVNMEALEKVKLPENIPSFQPEISIRNKELLDNMSQKIPRYNIYVNNQRIADEVAAVLIHPTDIKDDYFNIVIENFIPMIVYFYYNNGLERLTALPLEILPGFSEVAHPNFSLKTYKNKAVVYSICLGTAFSEIKEILTNGGDIQKIPALIGAGLSNLGKYYNGYSDSTKGWKRFWIEVLTNLEEEEV